MLVRSPVTLSNLLLIHFLITNLVNGVKVIFCGVGETCVHSCFCTWIKTTPPLLN